jgi:hypothetical protein
MKIKQTIELEINGKKISLTAAEARELWLKLCEIFDEHQRFPTPIIPHEPPWTVPITPTYPQMPPVWYCQQPLGTPAQ